MGGGGGGVGSEGGRGVGSGWSWGGGRGQGGCEQRKETFVRIQKKKYFVGGGGKGECERRSEAFVKKKQTKKKNIFFWCGGGRRIVCVWGVRVDVNGEVKLL